MIKPIKKRVALCLYGQPRFLENPHVIASHKSFILDKFDTKVFCHFWFNPEDEFFVNSDFSPAGGCSADYTAINYVHKNTKGIIFERYSPEVYVCERPRVFPPPDPLPEFCKNYKAYNEINISNFQSHLYSWQRVLELFTQNVEIENYDSVVITRYDCIFFGFPGFPDRKAVHAQVTHDSCVIDAKSCKDLTPFSDFNDIAPKVREFDTAKFKRIALQKNGLKINEIHSWKFGLARSNTDQTRGG